MEYLISITFLVWAFLLAIAYRGAIIILNEYDAQSKRREEAGREYIKAQKAAVNYLRSRVSV